MSLTKTDLSLIKNVMKITIDEELESKFEEKFDEKLSHLPSKDEFYDQTDKVMKELKAIREEMTVLSDLNRKVNDHDTRIEKIEEKLQLQTA